MWQTPGTTPITAEGYHLLCVQSPKVNSLVSKIKVGFNHQSVTSWRKAEKFKSSMRICKLLEVLAIFQVL